MLLSVGSKNKRKRKKKQKKNQGAEALLFEGTWGHEKGGLLGSVLLDPCPVPHPYTRQERGEGGTAEAFGDRPTPASRPPPQSRPDPSQTERESLQVRTVERMGAVVRSDADHRRTRAGRCRQGPAARARRPVGATRSKGPKARVSGLRTGA